MTSLKGAQTSLLDNRAFQRAMELDPDRPYSHTLCGHEFFAVEDFQKAQQCFEKAIVIDPRHYNAW